jgi:RNA-directed DNA polymerase
MSHRRPAPDKQRALPFAGRRGEASVGTPHSGTPVGDETLMERMVERHTLFAALAQATTNGGSPGIDGMTVEEVSGDLQTYWSTLRTALLAGTYRPSPVKRANLPKPGGGVWTLGISAVLDRFRQQTLWQGLQPEWDRTLSEHSDGLRPGRTAHQAVARAQPYRARATIG